MTIYGWTPGIGDPDLLGWLTVVGYVVAAILCWRAVRTARISSGREARVWAWLAAALGFLAVNKQLDLQSLLTAVGRHFSQVEGWYDDRRDVQAAFVLALMLAGLVGAILVARRLRGLHRAVQLAGVGMALLTLFVVVRAISFHHVDALLKAGLGGVRVNHLLEFGGIGIIAWAAFSRRRQPPLFTHPSR